MQTDSYRSWLVQRGLVQSSVSTRISDTKRVERHYGDLDELYAKNGLAGVLQELQYSADDKRRNATNPSKLSITGDLYNSLRVLQGGGHFVLPSTGRRMSPDRTSTPLHRKAKTMGGPGSSDLSATYRPHSGMPSDSWSQVWTSSMVAPSVPSPPDSSTSLRRPPTVPSS